MEPSYTLDISASPIYHSLINAFDNFHTDLWVLRSIFFMAAIILIWNRAIISYKLTHKSLIDPYKYPITSSFSLFKSKQPQQNVLNNYLGRGLKLDVSAVKAIRDTYCDSPSGSSENALPLSRTRFELLYETPERYANQRRPQMGSSIGEIREQRVEGLTTISKVPSHSTPKIYNQVANEKKRAKGIEDEFQDIQFQLVKHKKKKKRLMGQIANLKVLYVCI
ncbi:PREDICTED: uncharacterized protein LOC109241750 isoform X2 [Nicotiana attenuata]|uniref:uncharacterized protein LOC109241750 isoform X2 n=1 Tax=Nicotiana attenuata TaxID=49451 RepID=UPI0009054874|nr:PREDICTED: uncharacterized protein LOC109241750 isoform X2 [Nicotiana attenuata]